VHPTLRTQHRGTRSTQQHNTKRNTAEKYTTSPAHYQHHRGPKQLPLTFSLAPNAPPRTLGRGRLSAMPVFG
jgi:hypothetical protein